MNFRKLHYFLLLFLITGCEKDAPVAQFTASKTTAEVNEMITFTNQSEFSVSYQWDFGDGITSTVESPTHSYSAGGSYTVELTATGDGGTNSTTKIITITYPAPVADFSMDKTTADVDEIITFANQSENASTYSWDFGDGNTSTVTSPTHAYAAGGSYTVQLTATGDGGTNSTSKTIAIAYPLPVADFSMDKTTAKIGETVTFTNQSENASTYLWDFGDGNTSTVENPTHAYAAGGPYTVQLTATGDGGTNSTSKTIAIAYPLPVADFSMDKTTADVDEIITFTNQSVNASTYAWSFGDGSTSTQLNPTHSYSDGGSYTVQLTATGDGGSNSISKTITIEFPLPEVDFSMDKSTANVGETITFTNQTVHASTYQWDFGDGNTSTNKNPTHSYSTPGTFTVQLTATGEGGVGSTSKTVIIVQPEPVADFSMDKSVVDVGEIITFTNQSEHATSYAWDFGDGNTSTSENPTHSYGTEGTFVVQLTATGPGGVSDISKTVIVAQPPIAEFSMNKSTADIDEYITFTNQSENATSYLWDFGDGTTSTSTEVSLTHSYSTAGTFTVQLTATGDGGTNSTSQNVTIKGPLSLTGTWDKYFSISGTPFSAVMNIVQHSDGKLTGDFVFSDGSGYTPLLSSSNISGTSVTIEWMLVGSTSSYKMSYRGTVNAEYNYMSGSYYASGTYISTWTATKRSKKGASVMDSNAIISDKDHLFNILNNHLK